MRERERRMKQVTRKFIRYWGVFKHPLEKWSGKIISMTSFDRCIDNCWSGEQNILFSGELQFIHLSLRNDSIMQVDRSKRRHEESYNYRDSTQITL